MKCSKKISYSRKMKMAAVMLLCVFAYQLIYPNVAMALTTGPTQPEVQGFEPVGTTDMVDMFSGSFVYNIPLMDVEGYPVNISYHGGVSMEQEASWVGLGWNINPGTINRSVRGVPDDFNGDSLYKDFNIKPEKTLRVGVGAGVEWMGAGDPSMMGLSLSLGANVNVSNYKGVSCDFDLGGGINVMGAVSAGVNLGVGSQTGASIDYNANLSLSSSSIMGKDMAGSAALNVGIGGGYSTRSGVKDLNLSISASVQSNYKGKDGEGHGGSGNLGSTGANIPIGTKNYVAVITNSSTMSTIHGRIKAGFEALGGYGHGNVSAMFTTLTYANDASRDAFGYLYLQNARANNTSILDFARDKDGMFNKSMRYLPVPNMTYDIYSLSGQGTGGVFRPFRNDFGNVYDPFTTSSAVSTGGELEVGVGDAFEFGTDASHSNTEISSGPWSDYQRVGTKGFTGNSKGSVYENVYFKQGGELTVVDPAYYSTIGGTDPITPDVFKALPQTKNGSATKRDARANLIYYHTAQEDTVTGVGTNPDIISYTDNTFSTYSDPAKQTIKRIGTGRFQRKKDQISEIVQLQKDGRKYVYGIPAMNNVQREVTFTVDPTKSTNTVDLGTGIVAFDSVDATRSNPNGRDNYYNSTVTPSYAHSYLLTSVLSADYMDVTGNGISDDDLGSYTKLNYTRTDSDYRWIAPYSANVNKAQYNPGFWSDPLDDKGSFVCGSREQWNLHSIETKNFIAEFYTSVRHDAKGIAAPLLNAAENSLFNTNKVSGKSSSYELDSIKLYNKHDRFINTAGAVPVKTVFFVYDYSLCPGVPNADAGYGKLTLSKIYFRYGNSQKSMISPYQFGYTGNIGYDLAAKDRWGDYKPNNTTFTNYEFPYVDQNDAAKNTYSAAWSLNKITLPSGGVISANYESNDYAYVQNKPANEMFMIKGLGNGPSFINGSQLYKDKNTPYLYAYFHRRQASELPALTYAQNYLGRDFKQGGPNCMYFNFNLALTGDNNTYEQVKGYANVTDVGVCNNDSSYGYIKFQSVIPTGGGGTLNPITYTSLNVARYNLPQIVFPGDDPSETNMNNMLSGLKGAFNELVDMGKSPVLGLMKKGGGRNVNLDKSYVRMQNVGLSKKGGGQRVKALYFSDQWNALGGGNERTANYGKQYNYTISDPGYGTISSGVASYEPLIGGDENPLRQPIPYNVQAGNDGLFPNDPVDLYQETPIGESLFPGAQIGYSSVTVTSVHSGVGKSSQGVDKYEFYTAKDFPAQFIATGLNSNTTNKNDFFSQKILLKATQGYTLIFNDMHGKPKKVEHDVYNPTSQTMQPISYQVYNYRQNGNKLNNNVNCLVYNGTNMIMQQKQLGVEEDITMDSRQKNEHTYNTTNNSNVNFFIIPLLFPIPVLIPYGFTWVNETQNEFQSAVVTKVVQQYGIVDNVVSYQEGAVTTLQNEIYDANTGQPVVTSVTNEFRDKEYTTNIPAAWVYNGMSPAYTNIGYQDTGTITVGPHHVGTLNMTNTAPLIAGDELSVFYKDASGVSRHTNAWVLGKVPQNSIDTTRTIHSTQIFVPHYKIDTVLTDKNCYAGNIIPVSHYDSIKTDSFCLSYYGGPYCTEILATTDTGTLIFPDTCLAIGSTYIINATLVSFQGREWSNWCSCSPYDVSRDVTYPAYNTPVTVQVVGNAVAGGVTVVGSGYQSHGYITHETSFEFDGILSYHLVHDTAYVPDTTYTSYWHYDTTYTYTTIASCNGLNVLPRFPLNTPGWDIGTTLSNVSMQVISSGHKNLLSEIAESYTSMDNPVNSAHLLSASLTRMIDLKAKTYSDSNTRIMHKYIVNADTVNPYVIGQRGQWRLLSEYAYLTDRNYASVTSRTSGLYNANSLFIPSVPYSPSACVIPQYSYLEPTYADANWRRARTVTKWSPDGKEVENMDAIGNYSTALFGYKSELPVAVAANARQGEILADGFEDYSLLQYAPDILDYNFSPFNLFGGTSLSPAYNTLNVSPVFQGISIVSTNAHTGLHSMLISSGGSAVQLPVKALGYPGVVSNYNNYFSNDPLAGYQFTTANEYLPFELTPGKDYIFSCWIFKPGAAAGADYTIPGGYGITVNGGAMLPLVRRSNIIDGWQQMEIAFSVPSSTSSATLQLPANCYIDDVRIYPASANMKAFVYNPVNEKLMATLDENNFATMFEYDQEGNLVRTKKETAKGVMTLSESRSGNPKK